MKSSVMKTLLLRQLIMCRVPLRVRPLKEMSNEWMVLFFSNIRARCTTPVTRTPMMRD